MNSISLKTLIFLKLQMLRNGTNFVLLISSKYYVSQEGKCIFINSNVCIVAIVGRRIFSVFRVCQHRMGVSFHYKKIRRMYLRNTIFSKATICAWNLKQHLMI